MPNYICITCGTQYAESDKVPPRCLICEDDRQYVNPEGQSWIAPDDLKGDHYNVLISLEPGLTEVVTEPKFSLGGRALLVQASGGNVLWDCVSLVDTATVEPARSRTADTRPMGTPPRASRRDCRVSVKTPRRSAAVPGETTARGGRGSRGRR